jgi:hypothetical protein
MGKKAKFSKNICQNILNKFWNFCHIQCFVEIQQNLPKNFLFSIVSRGGQMTKSFFSRKLFLKKAKMGRFGISKGEMATLFKTTIMSYNIITIMVSRTFFWHQQTVINELLL